MNVCPGQGSALAPPPPPLLDLDLQAHLQAGRQGERESAFVFKSVFNVSPSPRPGPRGPPCPKPCPPNLRSGPPRPRLRPRGTPYPRPGPRGPPVPGQVPEVPPPRVPGQVPGPQGLQLGPDLTQLYPAKVARQAGRMLRGILHPPGPTPRTMVSEHGRQRSLHPSASDRDPAAHQPVPARATVEADSGYEGPAGYMYMILYTKDSTVLPGGEPPPTHPADQGMGVALGMCTGVGMA